MVPQSKTILIINVHSSQNIGDLALLEAAFSICRAAFEEPRLLALVNWPDEPYFAQADGFQTLPSPLCLAGGSTETSKWKEAWGILLGSLAGWCSAHGLGWLTQRIVGPAWESLFQAYRAADLVFSVPGNIFHSTGKLGWPFLTAALQVGLAHWFKKPVYVLPQSIGPLKRGWERSMLRSLYGRARRVYLRDQISLRLAQEIGLPEEVVSFAPDPAFALPGGSQPEALGLLSHYGFQDDGRNIGVTIISPMGRFLDPQKLEAYYSTLADVLEQMALELQVRIFLFNQVTGPTALEDDRLAVEKVLKMIPGGSSRIHWVNETLSPAMLKACYGQMQLFIASRLHSGIFALSMGVPTVFIGFLTKTRGVMEALGLENWVMDFSQVNSDLVLERVRSAWMEKESYAARLKEILPPIQQSISEIGKWISQDYEQYSAKNTPRADY
jgi:colanic acid/amylovoran biosynthesis protein